MPKRREWRAWVIIAAAIAVDAHAQNSPGVEARVGRSLTAIVDELRSAGVPLAYSTTLLRPNLTVRRAPRATEPLELVREILAPHALTLRPVDGLYLIVRAEPPTAALPAGSLIVTLTNAASAAPIAAASVADPTAGLAIERLGEGRFKLAGTATKRYGVTFSAVGFEPVRHSAVLTAAGTEATIELTPLPEEITELVVTASRYRILRELLGSPFVIDQRAFQQSPDFGDDPLRALHRLPGSAAGGASAKTHIRGGEEDETAIVLNGQRLLDPFHIRDYQSLFSSIDARAIDSIEVYTGGFPVRYGDRIGGVVLIDALTPDEPRHTELGVSVFNTSVLSAGTIGDGTGDWLVSARRGNLDRFINAELGKPSYHDFFGQLGVNFSDRTQVSANVLTASDRVLLVTESDPTEREQSSNDTQNTHVWAHWDQQWSRTLSSSTTFSAGTFDSTRVGAIDDPEKIVAAVNDRRDVAVQGMRQDWTLARGGTHDFSWGLEYQRSTADYDYTSSADYFGFFRTFEGVPATVRRNLALDADNKVFALYVGDRWQVTPMLTAELGLRWDRQGYSGEPNSRQVSPRVSLLRKLDEHTDVRVSLGRYYQSQGIHELQVEDGVSEFSAAQRADHAIVGVQHLAFGRYSLRAEAYWKSLRRLRSRYENLLDPLAIIPELEPDRVRIAPERGRAYGIELSVVYDGGDALDWWANYTRARVEDRVAGRDVARSWDQTHAWQAGATWDGPRWDLAAALNVHSGWPTTGLAFDQSDPDAPRAILGQRNALRLGSFASLDLRAGRRLPLRVGFLDVFLEVSNATNRQNPCCADFDLDDDNGNVVLEQQTDFWLPRLASFGVLWEF
jgi:hypothetical protein